MSKPSIIKCGVALLIGLICFSYVVATAYYSYGKLARNTIVNVRIGDKSVNIFSALKQAGINTDTEQRDELTRILKSQKAGFKSGE